MRWFAALFLLVLPVWAQAPAQQDQGTTAAGAIWTALESVSWGGAREEWDKANPGKKCNDAPGHSGVSSAGEDWCHVCQDLVSNVTVDWAFYRIDSAGPASCRLMQFRASSNELTGLQAEDAYQWVRIRLQNKFGAGTEPPPVPGQGSDSWRYAQQWKTGTLEILFFIDEPLKDKPGSRPAHIELIAHDIRLSKAREEEARLQEIPAAWVQRRDRELDAELRKTLETTLPDLPALLAAEDYQKLDGGKVRATLEILWKLTQIASGEKRAVLLLAVDRLADRLAPSLNDPKDAAEPGTWPSRTETSARLRYEYSPLGGLWLNTHSLLEQVRKDYPDSRWGEAALLLSERHGWHFGAGCPADPALFRQVIANGEKFLAQHPDSLHRGEVAFDLAQAYETWWSASQAPKEDDYVDASKYQQGAGEALQKAIAYYEEVARQPDTELAAYVRSRLPRLKAGDRVSQRRFYCIYD